ncbi:hypothetical protein [Chromobacterium sp. IIBBL 290-4]|uniref:hypothetical protein n=1 Tax=Chromobacterium sp. IIBBL 290-4 TaxID=2953890 RepID=UPI0020B8EE45|nr:hypothetical protein [Chromobacterium sp. IIBBL 290-4]UTH73574.1 hypothetical protein NKT35_18835 [Chromobacterium sp. IIBBL 290-4]
MQLQLDLIRALWQVFTITFVFGILAGLGLSMLMSFAMDAIDKKIELAEMKGAKK